MSAVNTPSPTGATSGFDALPPPPARGSWPAVVAVALGIFAIVTTEILPIGLLTSIGDTYAVSDGTAGLTMTLPGFVAAVAAPLVTVATARFDRRRMLAAFLLLLALANFLVAAAPSYWLVLVSRVLVGVTIGGFWSVGAGLAGRLVPARTAGRATAVIFAAVPVGSVLGVPLGTLVGDAAGWRTAFAAMGGFTLAACTMLVRTVPPLPASATTRPAALRAALRGPGAGVALALTFLLVLAHFGAYTYVTPFLEQVTRAGPELVTVGLLVFGAAGTAGTFIGAAAVAHSPRAAFAGAAALLSLATLSLPALGGSAVGALALLALWGLAYGAVPVCSSASFARAAPTAPEAASVLFTASFQATISLGALLGGVVVDHRSVSLALTSAGVTAAAAVLVACWKRPV
ncbi:MFS transporter [Streptomyces sp. NPDC020412]|uniref:MFS transporter n=1 Tax=Streptomyces sp. NPDC020412 TaxID=3365073 RepID=UPI0037ABDDFB